MIVDNLDIPGIRVLPYKADPPLIIDADAPLSGAVPGELLEPVSGRRAQEIKAGRRIQQRKFTFRLAANRAPTLRTAAGKKCAGALIPK